MNDLLRGASGFHLSPDEWDGSGAKEFCKISPQEALESGMKAYFSPQEGGSWSSIIVHTDADVSEKKEAWGRYGCMPQWRDGKFLLFRLDSFCDDKSWEKWSKALAWAFGGKSCVAFPYTGTAERLDNASCSAKDLETLAGTYRLVHTEDPRKLKLSLENARIASEIQSKPDVDEVASLSGVAEWSYDRRLNVVTWPKEYAGGPFYHVLRRLNGDLRGTMEWFNANRGWTFTPTPEDFRPVAEEGGYLVECGRDFAICDDGYMCTSVSSGGKAVEKKMGDFHLYVLYRVVGLDGVVVNWVKIVNPRTGYATPELQFPSESGKTPFTNWLIKYGFPFFGSGENVIDLHEQVARAPVPKIEKVTGLGFKKDALFLENGVWDMASRKFSKRQGKFWFSPDGKGYSCVMSNGNPVEDLKKLPSMPDFDSALPTPSAIAAKARDLYKGDAGLKAWAWLYGAMGFGAMGAQGNCPMFTVFGVKGAGKTEMNKIMARAFGYQETYSLESTTLFALRMAFSHLDRMPIFMSEYRRSIPHHDQKMQLLRSTYDRSSFSHGTAELKIISYDFSCLPSIDGEEAVSDPAVRSRSIQVFLSKNDQGDGGPEAFNAKRRDRDLDLTLASYLTHYDSDQTKYAGWRVAGQDIVAHAESRVRENLGILFAGCMAAAPDMESDWRRVIKSIGESISKDMDESSGVKEFVNKIGMYAPQMFDAVHVTDKHALFDVGSLIEFFGRKRVKMNLDVETYVQYAQRAGYEVNYFEFGPDGVRLSMKVPIDQDIDRAFLAVPEIYKIWKPRYGSSQ
jgi:hypothetical protein